MALVLFLLITTPFFSFHPNLVSAPAPFFETSFALCRKQVSVLVFKKLHKKRMGQSVERLYTVNGRSSGTVTVILLPQVAIIAPKATWQRLVSPVSAPRRSLSLLNAGGSFVSSLIQPKLVEVADLGTPYCRLLGCLLASSTFFNVRDLLFFFPLGLLASLVFLPDPYIVVSRAATWFLLLLSLGCWTPRSLILVFILLFLRPVFLRLNTTDHSSTDSNQPSNTTSAWIRTRAPGSRSPMPRLQMPRIRTFLPLPQ
jgi:hypothetical protein